ncbi:class III lanthipeptide [Latilactobacillus curvatus]|nr:class III lanthipeptide [Latilactobacillus curvatus]
MNSILNLQALPSKGEVSPAKQDTSSGSSSSSSIVNNSTFSIFCKN